MIKFTKMHGLGNDFIIIDNREGKCSDAYLARLSPFLCRRHFGIGADGLVVLNASLQAPFRMQIFNPDGSEAEMCGNAIRCLAKYVWEKKLIDKEIFTFETGAGIKEVKLFISGGEVKKVRTDMGAPILDSEEIPLSGPPRRAIEEKIFVEDKELYFTAVSMGNPHCVIFLPALNNVPWQRWGELLERHPLFPKRTNVEFVELVDLKQIIVKVWERGAGATLACGTGACAAVVAGVLTGRLQRDVKVQLPGGTLQVSWGEEGKVYMEGPAEEVFHGCIDDAKLIIREEAR